VEPKDAYLGLLAVSPLARRQGIGLLLAEECEHRAVADGATTIALVTSELMDAARAMYERLDYQPTESLSRYDVRYQIWRKGLPHE
jgi:ribosomal protein S18 acetylase RimI-like enzyme